LWDGELTEGIFTPQGFGIDAVDSAVIAPGSTSEENAQMLRD